MGRTGGDVAGLGRVVRVEVRLRDYRYGHRESIAATGDGRGPDGNSSYIFMQVVRVAEI